MNFDRKKFIQFFHKPLGTIVASVKKELFFSIRILSKNPTKNKQKLFLFFCLDSIEFSIILVIVGDQQNFLNQGSLRSPTLRVSPLVWCCFPVGPRNPSSNCAFSVFPKITFTSPKTKNLFFGFLKDCLDNISITC